MAALSRRRGLVILPSFPSSNMAIHASCGGPAASSLTIGRGGPPRPGRGGRAVGNGWRDHAAGSPEAIRDTRCAHAYTLPEVGTRNHTDTGV